MATAISLLNTTNEIAYLSGLFNWEMNDATWITPDGKSQVSFHVIDNQKIPITQYFQGAINTFNLVAGANAKDPNIGLFNTTSISTGIKERISRKYGINKIPFANYDQLTDQGVGGQSLIFDVIFSGTMYQTAMRNFVQYLFFNQNGSLGTLIHPFYNKINSVLPIDFEIMYSYDKLNCVICKVTFLTSDISHLNPANIIESTSQKIGKWYVGVQNAVSSTLGAISTIKAQANQIKGIL